MKSRLQWLIIGDRNTSIFHTTTLNKRSNKILQIQIYDQTWVTNQQDIGKEFISHLITTYSEGSTSQPKVLLNQHHFNIPKLNSDFHPRLTKITNEEEIKNALTRINPLKTLEDGLHTIFFQKN